MSKVKECWRWTKSWRDNPTDSSASPPVHYKHLTFPCQKEHPYFRRSLGKGSKNTPQGTSLSFLGGSPLLSIKAKRKGHFISFCFHWWLLILQHIMILEYFKIQPLHWHLVLLARRTRLRTNRNWTCLFLGRSEDKNDLLNITLLLNS